MRLVQASAFGAVSLCVLFALTGAGGIWAQSGRQTLKGQRLFFTPEQRLVADGESVQVKPDSLQNKKGQRQMVLSAAGTESQAGSNKKVRGRGLGIEFDALVTGDRGVRLLVNGLPCHAPKPVKAIDRKTPIQLDCSSLGEELRGLVLLMVSGGLQVSRGQHILGILQPGEAL